MCVCFYMAEIKDIEVWIDKYSFELDQNISTMEGKDKVAKESTPVKTMEPKISSYFKTMDTTPNMSATERGNKRKIISPSPKRLLQMKM